MCKGGDTLGDIEAVNETYSDNPVGSLHQDIGSLASPTSSSIGAGRQFSPAAAVNTGSQSTLVTQSAQNTCQGCTQVASSDRGVFGYEPRNPESPFAATPEFAARFRGSSEEAAVLKTIIGVSTGTLKPREILGARRLELPGGAKTFYHIYQTGTAKLPGPGRIANVPGSRTYYYSPNHYNPLPDVPHSWVEIEYPAVDWK